MKKQSAFTKVSSVSFLKAAFTHIYSQSSSKSKYTSGIDGQTLRDFNANKDELLKQLSSDLMKKRFSFSALSPHFVIKDSGKERVICVPTVRDRIVQRALLNYLDARYGSKIANPISYGFVNEKGVKKAAVQSCLLRKENPWVFKTDISSFFDRVPRAVLKDRLRKMIREPSLIPLIESAVDCEIFLDSPSTEVRIKAQGIQQGVGVRQGMPMSPFFSNVILNRFDRAVVDSGYPAVRYADDLIFFAASEAECKVIHGFCEQELLAEGFEIPKLGIGSKSQIYAEHEAAEFLGLTLVRTSSKSYVLIVSQNQMHRIRTELFKLTDINYLNKLGIDFFKFGQALNSRVGGYANAYSMCTNLSDLENRLEDMRIKIYSTVLEKLGIKFSTLSKAAKTFFKVN